MKTHFLIEIGCYSQGVGDCPTLLGMYDGVTEEAVSKKLGKPSYEQIDGVAKKIEYESLGTWFYLTKKKIYMLGVKTFRRSSGPEPVSPPAECATAKNAAECADTLEKLGKNPFDAFGYVGSEPVYGGQSETHPPACKNGAASCEPWERDWSTGELKPGSVVTKQGTIVQPDGGTEAQPSQFH